MNLKDVITEYPDFPKEGILFRDFGPILKDPSAMKQVVDDVARHFDSGSIDLLAGIESRGFILASCLAAAYDKGMIMIRKPGKLPGKTIKRSYKLEYGESTIEIQKDAISSEQRVLICDDLLATGGTARAAGDLVEDAGGSIAGYVFVVELAELRGAQAIAGHRHHSVIRYG